ncbi:hypothetical protein C8R46DRAFT_357786 [Mycena filopes]|nr:hypothetical protein C8R46DRAFT_357786 [Mycena filopes]
MFLLTQPLLRPCCYRRGLQRIHLIQRRTFYLKESHYAWTTPVPHNARYPRDTNAVYEVCSVSHIVSPVNPSQLPSGVNTFNPNHLTSAEYFDISESPLRTLYRRFAKHMMDAHSRQWGEQVPTRNTPFPPGSKGFLYFHSPPKDSPLVGNVRFRLAEQPDKEGFAAGHDLLLAHGLPWKLPLLEVVNTPPYIHFLRVLTGDGFVPPMLKLACESANTPRDSVFISSFGEPWVVNWGTEYSRIYITRPEIHPLPILVHHPWYRRRLNSSTAPAAFAGRGIVSMVKMPDDKLGLRIEKILVLDRHSVKRNAIEPVEGLITELGFHMIQASTKLSFDRRLESGEYVMPTLKRLSEFEPNADPFKIYRHEARRPRPPAAPLAPLEVGHKDAPRRAQLQHAFAPASTPCTRTPSTSRPSHSPHSQTQGGAQEKSRT